MKATDTVAAIESLWEEYGCEYPPKPNFDHWPEPWCVYRDVCDVMPEMLHNGGNPQEFRTWMTSQLTAKVNLEATMMEIKKHYSKKDRCLLGFFGCLTFLKNAYRWGALPARPEERSRQTLDFPEILDKPMLEIASLYGVAPYGHIFSLKVTNTIYENDKPVRMRFHFNNDLKIQQSEENFFMSFVDVDNFFKTAVCHMRDYLRLTREAENDHNMAVQHFSERARLLTEIRAVLVQASKIFSSYTQGGKINKEDWGRYVQSAATWGLNGKGGASGGETFTFQILDEFLHIPGKCLMYRSKPLRREHMADGLCQILYSLSEGDHNKRFSSFLGLEQSVDPLWKLREELAKTIHLWRLSHAHVVRRFLEASNGLATGLDKKMDVKNSLAKAAEGELLERARETIGKTQHRDVQKQTVKTSPMYDSMVRTIGSAVSSFAKGIAEYYVSFFSGM